MASPNTHREALMAELLGDAGKLADRLEALSSTIPKTIREAKAELGKSVEASHQLINESCVRLSRVIDQQTKDVAKITATGVAEARQVVEQVHSASRRLLLLLFIIPALTGGIAGAGVYFALKLSA